MRSVARLVETTLHISNASQKLLQKQFFSIKSADRTQTLNLSLPTLNRIFGSPISFLISFTILNL